MKARTPSRRSCRSRCDGGGRRPTSSSRFAKTRSRGSTASRPASPASSRTCSASTTSTGRPRGRRSNGRSSSGTTWRACEAVEIEPALVDAVLDEVETGKVQLGDGVAAPASSADGGEGRIEAPYLQLVLSRLWAEERSSPAPSPPADARTPRWRRADRAHPPRRDDGRAPAHGAGCRGQSLPQLSDPSGTKIAHRADDLAELTDVPSARLEPVLAQLAGEVRILRTRRRRRVRDLSRRPRRADPSLARRRQEPRRGAVASGGGSRCSFRRLVLMLVAAGFLALFVTRARRRRCPCRARRRPLA